jgi:hypothetical protein
VAVGRSLGRPTRPPRQLLRFLSVHHDWAVKQDWADEYAADLHALWVRCKALTGTFDGRPEPMNGVPCPFPDCIRMALVRYPGEAGRTCDKADGGCGRWLSDEEYERWTKLDSHSAKEAVPVTKVVRSSSSTVVVQQIAANGHHLTAYDCAVFADALAEAGVPDSARVEITRDPDTFHSTGLLVRHSVRVPEGEAADVAV